MSLKDESNLEPVLSEEPKELVLENTGKEDSHLNSLKEKDREERKEESNGHVEDTSGEEDLFTPKIKVNRKRKFKEDPAVYSLTGEFLNACYPISSCMSKYISIGVSKQENCAPTVTLRHGARKVTFNEKSWESFNKYLHLIECYLTNQVNGKKTNIILDNSDNEVENIKMRGGQYVRFRDVTKHDEKITLSPEEFEMLVAIVPAINRYMSQLTLSLPMIKDYLSGTLESNSSLLYGPVDASIYNRLPQEVFHFRRMKAKWEKKQKEDKERQELFSDCCYKHERSIVIPQEETNLLDG